MADLDPDLKARAQAGDPQAQYAVGFAYYAETDLASYKESARWIEAAAEQGYAPALFMLGFFYEQGLGVEPNPKEAYRCYEEAAMVGYAPAQCNLGALLEEGLGCRRNRRAARRWYESAEKLGSLVAKANLERLAQ